MVLERTEARNMINGQGTDAKGESECSVENTEANRGACSKKESRTEKISEGESH